MDSEYLKSTVGEPLAMAMAAATVAQAEDQVDFVANWLLNHVKVQAALKAATAKAAEMDAARALLKEEAEVAAAAAAAIQDSKDSGVGKVAGLAEDKEARFQAAYATLLEHSQFSSAYVAEVDFDDLPPPVDDEGNPIEVPPPEEGAPPVPEGPKPASGLRYVSASAGNEFMVGATLAHGTGVSLACADAKATVQVPNVFQSDGISFFRSPRFGAYACSPIVDPASGDVVALLCADSLLNGGPLTPDSVAMLEAVAVALGTAHAAGRSFEEGQLAERLAGGMTELGDFVEDAEDEPVPEFEDDAAKEAWLATKKAKDDDAVAAALAKRQGVEADLLSLDRNKIAQLKTYKRPPPSVHKVLKAVLFLLKKKPSEVKEWNACRQLVTASDFLKSLVGFDASVKMPKKRLSRVQKMLTAVGLEAAKKASLVALLLFNWAVATLEVHKAYAAAGEKVEAAADEGDDEGDTPDADEEPLAGLVGKKVLLVTTSAAKMGEHDTGLWLEELAAPYYLFQEAGCEVTVASVAGGKVPLDAGSLSGDFLTEDCVRFQADADATAALNNSVSLASATEGEGALAAYNCVFLAGGHGACADFVEGVVPEVLSSAWQLGSVVAAVCHGVVGLIGAKESAEEGAAALVAGKAVACFSTAEEEMVGLKEKVPFLLEDKIKELGATVTVGDPWSDTTEAVGKLVTGQNPQSSLSVARLAMEAMLQ